jgi:hypothetical protein
MPTMLRHARPDRIGGNPNSPRAYTRGVCVQCVAGAMTAGVAATGMRAWLATRLSPRLRRALTWALIVGGVLAAGVFAPTA